MSIKNLLAIALVLVIFLKAASFIFTWWLADYYLASGNRALKQQNYNQSTNLYLRAYKLNSTHPIIQMNLAKSLTFQAVILNQQILTINSYLATASAQTKTSAKPIINQTQQKLNQVIDLINQLIPASLAATPSNLDYRKRAVRIYALLGTVDSTYYQAAINLLTQTIPLAPTDPKLPFNLGLLYSFTGNPSSQEKYLTQAIALKPNYDKAYHQLALFYDQTNQKTKLARLIQKWQKANPNSPSLKKWQKKIAPPKPKP
ncbi:MAG: hypothetical protein GXP43_02380 [bacterium]|nr:hypothetical protein [bacterium]